MNLTFRQKATTAALVAALGGCGAVVPGAAPGSAQGDGVRRAAAQRDPGGALLYLSSDTTNDVYVYAYPNGVLTETLTGFNQPSGLCVDAKGDVFVSNGGNAEIVEYAHGASSPKATLKDPGESPSGCAVDPTTGDLAAVSGDTVTIYPHARGSGAKTYTTPIEGLFCAYDTKGDLFVDGSSSSNEYSAGFAVLPRGGKAFTTLTLDVSMEYAGGIQWDGKYLAIGDQANDTIYRFAISGSTGTKVGEVQLKGAWWIVQFWIDGAQVAGADSERSRVEIWSYPAGGRPVRKRDVPNQVLFGVTISK